MKLKKCNNCGKQLKGNETFCGNCGSAIPKNKIKLNKKLLLIIPIALLLVFLSMFIIRTLDKTTMKWDDRYEDNKVSATLPRELKLNVLAYTGEEKSIRDIDYKVDGGEIEVLETTVTWTLPDEIGEYKITAKAPSGKTITKTITVITLDEISLTTTGLQAGEKIDNSLKDTDSDGIPDELEKSQTKTDPSKKDTDGDGIWDGDELDLGLDPLKKDSKSDGISDGDRKLSYQLSDEDNIIEMNIKGKKNIANTSIDVYKNRDLIVSDALLDQVFVFHTYGELETAEITVSYSLEDINAKGLKEDNLKIIYLNDETGKYEAVETSVDKTNQTLTAELSHFSRYGIGDFVKLMNHNYDKDLLFVIDNSGSMTGRTGTDPEYRRLSLTNEMIDKLNENYSYSVSEFSGNYVNIIDFSKDKTLLKEKVNEIETKGFSSGSGTNIIKSLEEGIKEFNNSENNYLLLLTDGENTKGSLEDKVDSIVSAAKEKDVIICVVGIGNSTDYEELTMIARATGCNYYNASSTDSLDKVYEELSQNINDNFVDTNSDNKIDSVIVANSGFIASRDGLSFKNHTSTKTDGNCYGYSTFSNLRYRGELPIELGASIIRPNIFFPFPNASGFDLNNTYFEEFYKPLYNYQIENETLQFYLNKNLGVTKDFFEKVDDDTVKLKKEYRIMFDDLGFKITKVELSKSAAEKMKIKYYDWPVLDIDNERLKDNVSKDDYQLLVALYRLQISQIGDGEKFFWLSPDKAFKQLNSELKSKNPSIISVKTDNYGHAINATKLIQSITDPNIFKIEVYDSNAPGNKRYIELKRVKNSKLLKLNKYHYDARYQLFEGEEFTDVNLSINTPKL